MTTDRRSVDSGRPRAQHWLVADRRDLSSPTHPSSQALHAYWQSKCPPGGLPQRDDIAPSEMLKLLPNLQILEPIGGDWHYRLVGTGLAHRYGFDWTGKRLTELYLPPTAKVLIAAYDHVARSKAPAFAMARAVVEGREHVVYELNMLPILARDGTNVWLLLGMFFHN